MAAVGAAAAVAAVAAAAVVVAGAAGAAGAAAIAFVADAAGAADAVVAVVADADVIAELDVGAEDVGPVLLDLLEFAHTERVATVGLLVLTIL